MLDPHPRKHGPGRAVLIRLERIARGESPEPEKPPSAPSPPAAAPDPPAPLSPSAVAAARRLKDAGLEPPLESEFDPADLAAVRDVGEAVRVSRTLHYHAEVLSSIRARLIALAERNGGAVTLQTAQTANL